VRNRNTGFNENVPPGFLMHAGPQFRVVGQYGMTLVATMSVLICARIESLDCIGLHLLHRQIDVIPSRCTCQTLPESYPGYQDCG